MFEQNYSHDRKHLQFFHSRHGCAYFDTSLLQVPFIRFDSQQKFSGPCSELLETIIQSKGGRISNLVSLFAFSNLLLVPKKPIEFIEQGGLEQLKSILEKSEGKIKISYYGLLCYWILSYEEKFVTYTATPSVSGND